jgi:hypothetical protein
MLCQTSSGQLGIAINDNVVVDSFVKVYGLAGVIAIVAGYGNSFAITSNGTL